MGLTPKPTSQDPLYTWEDLNSMLQIEMKKSNKSKKPYFVFDPDEFEMSTEEIINGGKEAGYEVETLQGPEGTLLKFS